MPSVTGSGDSFGAAVRAALQQVSLGRARPSYNRTGAVAQYRQLARSKAGREALRLSGVIPADRTARRWLTRQQQPSAANRAAIAQAYAGMRRGGIPEWVKHGRMEITGRVAYGPDIRDRGSEGHAPLRVDCEIGNRDRGPDKPGTGWDDIEDWPDLDDDDLEELIAEELIAEDIGDGYEWGFPGGAYTVTFSG